MLKVVTAVVALSIISVGAAAYLDGRPKLSTNGPIQPQQASVTKNPNAFHSTAPQPATGKTARIKMDSRGHFLTTARMNGRSIKILVDTGATSVALNEKTARRLGMRLKKSDFKYRVNTANGVTKAAKATIDKVQIGRVTVHNVEAAILQGKGLNGTLLGMSFLGKLREFKITNGELIMRQ